MHENPHGELVARSSTPFNTERIHAAAVYCSDGRFGAQFDEFIRDTLGLPRYDRLAVPGGAAALADYIDAWRERDVVHNQLRFLIDVHSLERVILIAHEGCAFYTERLSVAALDLASRQREDLVKAAEFVHEFAPHLQVEAYFAHIDQNAVAFERIVSASR